MDSDDVITFNSMEEELNHWKDLAQLYLIEKQELQREFTDFTDESQQLEKELEISLEHAEKSNKDLRQERERLQKEIESLQMRLEQSSREITTLQSEITSLKNERHTTSIYIRELEQKNDDLERAQRVVAESIAAAESTLNTAIERNALLESEVDEKEQLKIKLQRLMDETRDLKQELLVRERTTIPDNERALTNGHTTPQQPIDSNRLLTEMSSEHQSSSIIGRPPSPAKRDPNVIGSPMTPSARLSALNLVGDILRKMGIHLKCRTCGNLRCECQTQSVCSRQNSLKSLSSTVLDS
ncbi:nuclear distribution protein nudE-like 1 isoform X2 [Chrysoperla carnea]|uniref:nuclear distribution protein nudE-like 1 isoform X2 n=1 Tax=Chrysoperla carnea TaxID=189513 RepID=UPI001D08BD60|nr:nuclear distribution protein nudE-like 1 isoform X2 [Chrysoperla carnea]